MLAHTKNVGVPPDILIAAHCPCCGQPMSRQPERNEVERRLGNGVIGGRVSVRVIKCLIENYGQFVTVRRLLDVVYMDEDGGPLSADANVRKAIRVARKRIKPLGVEIVGKSHRGYCLRLTEDATP